MKKIRYAVRNQIEMQILSLDQMLPANHVARDILAYVEKMDLSALLSEIKSLDGEAGAPAFDPKTLMALWLYATVDSVGSSRVLAQLIVDSLPYRWLAGGDAINYHTLSDFRMQNEAVMDQLLTASVVVLAQEGRMDLEAMTVSHDGMRVRASAGRSSMHRRATLEKTLAAAQAHVENLKKQEGGERPEATNLRREAARERAARERVGRLEQALDEMKKLEAAKRKRSDRKERELRVSSTDPECRVLRMANGGKDPAHNLQFTTEVQTRAITSVMVAPGSDTGMLLPAMKQHERAHGKLPARVLGDRGFFKYADIEALEREPCEVLVPDLYPKAAHRGKAGTPMIQRWRERMKSEEAKSVYKLRCSTVEWSNACLRQQGLQQLTVRGRTKVRLIGVWHALAHNITRIWALRRQPTMTPA